MYTAGAPASIAWALVQNGTVFRHRVRKKLLPLLVLVTGKKYVQINTQRESQSGTTFERHSLIRHDAV